MVLGVILSMMLDIGDGQYVNTTTLLLLGTRNPKYHVAMLVRVMLI